jgi:hypothetical protein
MLAKLIIRHAVFHGRALITDTGKKNVRTKITLYFYIMAPDFSDINQAKS